MFRYQILIEYVGTNFRGWQVQKKGKTIQGLIQEKISNLFKEKIILLGSGRTDTGVHAIEQSAHFDCKNQIKDYDRFLKSINYFLNKDGVILLHDCLPRTIWNQVTPRLNSDWNGDVWKSIVHCRTFKNIDTYTIIADRGIGLIFPRKNKKIIKIYNSKNNYTNTLKDYKPGIILFNDKSILVSTKDGFIEILELQIQGKRKMTSFEFINGYKKLDKQQLN